MAAVDVPMDKAGWRGHPLFARFYARVSPRMEKIGYGDRREALLAGLRGRVVEVGAGPGLNLAHYPPEVAGVLAVEPERHLRSLAQRNAQEAAVPVEVVDGVAEHLPAPDGAFDGAVVSLVLCTVARPREVLEELHRVVKPGGELRFLEHVRADSAGLRRVQRLLDATVWPRLNGGCHIARDTVSEVEDAGFRIEQLDQFPLPDSRVPLPSSPHILGTATREA